MSSVSSDGHAKQASLVPLLADIMNGLKKMLENTSRLMASERRQRRSGDKEEALTALHKVQRKLNSVQTTLESVPTTVAAKEKKRPQPPTNQKRFRATDDDDDIVPDKLKRAKRVQTKKVAAAAPAAAISLIDGGAAVIAGHDDDVLFFSNFNARDGNLFVCPSFDDGPRTIDRKNLRPVDFESLTDEKRRWYLGQLQIDILKRFETNAASLFAAAGRFMIDTRQQLMDDPANAGALMQSFAEHAAASPHLNAANNTALMLTASLHKQLSEERAEGWSEKFEARMKEMCNRCSLKFNTMIRWRATVGNLMLRSSIIACMLPYFVAQNANAIKALLEDEVARDHLEHTFEAKMRGVAQVMPPPPPSLPREEDDDQLLLSFNKGDVLALDDIFHF